MKYRIWLTPLLALVVVAVADTTTKRAIKSPVDLNVPATRDDAAARLRDVAREGQPLPLADCEKAPKAGAARDPRCTYGKNGPILPVVPQNPSDTNAGRPPVVENPPVRLSK